MAQPADPAPPRQDAGRPRANDNRPTASDEDNVVRFEKAAPADPRENVPLGVDDMAAGRLTPGAAIEAQRAHLAGVARNMDTLRQRRDGTIAPQAFRWRFPVAIALIALAVIVLALALT